MYTNIAERAGVDVDRGAAPGEAIEVVVYSKPSCMQCAMTYRELDARGVSYRVVDLSEDAGALAYVKGLGYLSAPVVVVGGAEHWAGFRPDRISTIDRV